MICRSPDLQSDNAILPGQLVKLARQFVNRALNFVAMTYDFDERVRQLVAMTRQFVVIAYNLDEMTRKFVKRACEFVTKLCHFSEWGTYLAQWPTPFANRT